MIQIEKIFHSISRTKITNGTRERVSTFKTYFYSDDGESFFSGYKYLKTRTLMKTFKRCLNDKKLKDCDKKNNV